MGALPEIYHAPIQWAVRRIYQGIIHPRYQQAWKRRAVFIGAVPEAGLIAVYGAGMIEGILTEQGVPSGERVVAMRRDSMTISGMAQADPTTGRWRIYPLVAGRRYVVMGVDAQLRFNAIVADGVLPVPWEESP